MMIFTSLITSSLGMYHPWLAGARAKHVSIGRPADKLELFAAVCMTPGAAPAVESLEAETEAFVSWFAADPDQTHFGAPAEGPYAVVNASTATIGFTDESYASMRDDESRTPLFAQAIKARLSESPKGTLVVLDIGTGPHAVLALLAAQAGARKVYAVEVNIEMAARARETIKRAGWSHVIEVVEGFSTQIELSEKVDLVVSEIVGSVASEEGCYTTIRDAHARLVRHPQSTRSWIPYATETWGCPCSYPMQYALGPPKYDWGRIDEPLRLSCLDTLLLPLATPQCIEDISFTSPLPAAANGPPPMENIFTIEQTTLDTNEQTYLAMLQRHGVLPADAKPHARDAARSLSGV